MNRSNSGNRRAIVGMASASAFVALTGGLLAGCGSGGGTAPSSPLYTNLLGNGGSGATTFAGRSYQSTVALADGQVGNLTVTTSASGNAASGTLSIVDPSRSAAKTRLVIATPFLSGTFDPTTGAIHLTGAYTVNGQTFPISITGTLPVPPSFTGGSVTYVVGSQTYTSTFGGGGSVNPTPSPSASTSPSPSASASPFPSPSSSPIPTPSPSATPAPTGPVNTITITGGTTNVLHALTNTHNLGAGIFHSAPVTNAGYISFTLSNGSSGSADEANLEVDIQTGATLAPGTYPVTGPSGLNANPGVVGVSYGEFSGGFRNYQAQPSKGVSGQVVVEQVSPTLVRIRLENVAY